MYPVIAASASLILIASLLYVFHRWENSVEPTLKIMTVVFCLLGLSRLILFDNFAETVLNFADPLQTFLRWGYHIGYAVIPMAVFTKSRLFRNIATYFSSAMALLSVIFINSTMEYILSTKGHEFGSNVRLTPFLHYFLYISEIALALAIPVLMAIKRKHKIEIHNREELIHIAIGLPAILVQMMPSYIPQSLFGYTSIDFSSFSPFHLGWIVLIAVECVILYLYFRHRSAEDKYNLLLFLVFAQVFHTVSIFLRGFLLGRMPIQLCSIAAFFYFFTVATRSRSMFGFCYLANIVGAVVAIFLAAFDVGAMYFFTLHYIYEHTFVMLMPILAVALGVFPRLERRDLSCALGVFTIYFLACYTSGILINTLTGVYTVNYFYMFDYSVALKYVPFATFTGAIEISLGALKVYPILIGVIYMVFVLLISGFYAMMRGFYRLADRVHHRQEQGAMRPRI